MVSLPHSLLHPFPPPIPAALQEARLADNLVLECVTPSAMATPTNFASELPSDLRLFTACVFRLSSPHMEVFYLTRWAAKIADHSVARPSPPRYLRHPSRLSRGMFYPRSTTDLTRSRVVRPASATIRAVTMPPYGTGLFSVMLTLDPHHPCGSRTRLYHPFGPYCRSLPG